MDLDTVIAECQLSHRSLRHTLGQVDDDVARGASRLPGWTVGHLMTHIARNAESQIRVLRGAARGDHLEQYEGGTDQRAADIEQGATRSAGELIDDVISTFVALEETWDAMTPQAWEGFGYQAGLEWPCRQLPFFRWREVEIHHVDLNLGYEFSNCPPAYVEAELRLALAGLPSRIDRPQDRASWLAWLIGRQDRPSFELGPWKPRPDSFDLVPGYLAPSTGD